MIRKQDILARAREWKLRAEVVEKDYVLGWLLAALALDDETSERWVLKGGTCVKKCFLETYRFSEDLDFSLLPEAIYSRDGIAAVLRRVATRTSEMSGLAFPSDQIVVVERHDKLGNATFETRLGYRGPLDTPGWPKVRFDITNHEPVLDPAVLRRVLHPYPDALPDASVVSTYSLEELLAEKTRALLQRSRPRDLYDVVYIGANAGSFASDRLREIWRSKLSLKGIALPTRATFVQLVRQSDEIRADWDAMLAHQLPERMPFETVLERLEEALLWMEERAPSEASFAVALPSAAGVRPLVEPGVRLWSQGVPLETVRFAGANRLLVEFNYHHKLRLVEPYALRIAGSGNLLLYAYERQSDQIKAFKVAEIEELRATTQPFTPRYAIELGLISAVSERAGSRPARRAPVSRVTYARLKSGPIYEIACSLCGKHFRRKKRTTTLRKHRLPDGSGDCPGRLGYLVSVT